MGVNQGSPLEASQNSIDFHPKRISPLVIGKFLFVFVSTMVCQAAKYRIAIQGTAKSCSWQGCFLPPKKITGYEETRAWTGERKDGKGR